jgi:hypothetical protein
MARMTDAGRGRVCAGELVHRLDGESSDEVWTKQAHVPTCLFASRPAATPRAAGRSIYSELLAIFISSRGKSCNFRAFEACCHHRVPSSRCLLMLYVIILVYHPQNALQHVLCVQPEPIFRVHDTVSTRSRTGLSASASPLFSPLLGPLFCPK